MDEELSLVPFPCPRCDFLQASQYRENVHDGLEVDIGNTLAFGSNTIFVHLMLYTN